MGDQGIKKLIHALTADHSRYPSDWFRAMLSSLKQMFGVEPHADESDLSRHPTVAKCVKAYAAALEANAPFVDILGLVYMELAGKWKQSGLGQFFTPQNVAIMMASMIGVNRASQERLTSVMDPACGSGVMLLSYMQVIHRMGQLGELKEFLFAGVDLDPVCADMTAVQVISNCNLHQLEVGELIVVRGNSLMPWETWQTVVHATAKDREPIANPQSPEFREAIKQAATPQDQLSLFGEAA